MSLLRDKHIRYLSCFIIGYIVLFFGCSTWFLSRQTDSARQMLLSRENTMVSALLDQGVPEHVVAAAVAKMCIRDRFKSCLFRWYASV